MISRGRVVVSSGLGGEREEREVEREVRECVRESVECGGV